MTKNKEWVGTIWFFLSNDKAQHLLFAISFKYDGKIYNNGGGGDAKFQDKNKIILTQGFWLNIPLDQQPCCGTEHPRLPTSCQFCSKEKGYGDVF